MDAESAIWTMMYSILTSNLNNNTNAVTTLTNILTGTYTIERKPWKIKEGDEFYYIDCDGIVTHFLTAGCDADDYINYYKLGNCYRTEKEALANREKWKAFYESDEVLEV